MILIVVPGPHSHQCRHPCPCLSCRVSHCCCRCLCCCHRHITNNIALNAANAAAVAIAFTVAIIAVLALAAAVTATVVAFTAAIAATAVPLPSPPLSSLLQPPPMSPCLQNSHRWLVVVLSVSPHLLCRPPSKFVSPHHRGIVDAFAAGPPYPFADHCQPLSCCSCPEHQLPLLLPLMVSCCTLCLPRNKPTESPS